MTYLFFYQVTTPTYLMSTNSEIASSTLKPHNNMFNKDNAFVKHRKNYHKGEEEDVEFKLSLVKQFKKPQNTKYGRVWKSTRPMWTSS